MAARIRLPVLIFLFLTAEVHAEDFLLTEFQISLEQTYDGMEQVSISPEEAAKRMLAEAVFVFSGMIYGFNFVYTPLDLGRRVDEFFELKPVYTIPWGDKSLKVLDTRLEGGIYVGRILYSLSEQQQQYRLYWSSGLWSSAEGVGTARYFDGWEMKIESWKEGIKMAVREDMRAETRNKPKEIRGQCVLSDYPYTTVGSGDFRSKVRVIYRVTELVPYSVH